MREIVRVEIGGIGLRLEALDDVITRVAFDESGPPAKAPRGVLHETARQLEEYFGRRRRQFTIPVIPAGTGFQHKVWTALLRIPYGETRTYLDIARAIGKPGSVRAVGAANGANPIAIIIPCHRVIGSDGSLTGYGGGMALKRRLLVLEGALRPEPKAHQHSLFAAGS